MVAALLIALYLLLMIWELSPLYTGVDNLNMFADYLILRKHKDLDSQEIMHPEVTQYIQFIFMHK